MINIFKTLWKTPDSDSLSWDDEELGRKIIFLNILHIMAIPYFALFAIIAFVEKQYLVSLLDAATFVLITVNIIIIHVFHKPQLSIYMTTVPLSCYIVYLYFNGINSTPWVATVPPAAYFLLGSMGAGILTFLFSVLLTANAIHPVMPSTNYPLSYEMRVIAAFLMLTAFAHALNILRKKAFYSLKQRSIALKDSENRYKTIFETTPTGIAIMSYGGNIIEVNPAMCAIFGYKREEIFQLGSKKKSETGFMSQFEAMKSALVSHGHFSGEGIEYHKNGNHVHLKIRISPFQSGNESYLLVMLQDVTAQIKAEKDQTLMAEKLHWSEKMQAIGQLAGGVAHDINNNLATILGYAEIISEKTNLPPAHQKYIGRIIESVNHSAGVTSKLLAFARRGKFQNIAIDIHHVLGDVSELIRHSVDKRIKIKHEFFAPYSTVKGDPSQIQSAILNVAINACDAMQSGGQLRFKTNNLVYGASNDAVSTEASVRGPCIRIDVIDTGAGMDSETRKHLFEPYFTTKKAGKGLGMGLAAAYGAITNHKGTIQVASEPGNGTTFSILLPLLTEPEETLSANTRKEHPLPPFKGGKILVVDDEEPLREMAEEILREQGYTTIGCANGQEAVDIYSSKKHKIDLIILDLVMPVKGGAEAFLEIMQINPSARIILCSGFTVDVEASELLKKGALDFLQKPYSQHALTRAVRKGLS